MTWGYRISDIEGKFGLGVAGLAQVTRSHDVFHLALVLDGAGQVNKYIYCLTARRETLEFRRPGNLMMI